LSEIRTGLGWDVHRLAPGRPLILGGVTVPSELGLEGHSDADVLSHAITDAILGAAALGDIGMHFPDSDPRWKGANSLVFLRHAKELVAQQGYRIVNVDATIVLERPKLKDYRQAIRERIAETLEIEPDRVSVKFKTAEQVGPVGELRSAESQAVVTLAVGSSLARFDHAHPPGRPASFQALIGLLLFLRGDDGLAGITAFANARSRDELRAAAPALLGHRFLER